MRYKNMIVSITGAMLIIMSIVSMAADKSEPPANNASIEENIKLKLMSRIAKVTINSVKQSVFPGLYEVDTSGGIIYVSADGQYFISGDLYGLTTANYNNLTEISRDKQRVAELAKIDPKEMIIFSPPANKVKATITVFTDVDCPYCRKLHAGMQQMNDLGIAVRYLAFPRAGINSETYQKMVSVWCATDPKEALTKALSGEAVQINSCVNNPVAKEFELAQKFGAAGTPTIVFEDGRLVSSYIPPDILAKNLGITVLTQQGSTPR